MFAISLTSPIFFSFFLFPFPSPSLQVPRITRAQKMDTLSSQANLSGYRAVIEALAVFPRFSKAQVTAAGKVAPCTVLVIGAGVAGTLLPHIHVFPVDE